MTRLLTTCVISTALALMVTATACGSSPSEPDLPLLDAIEQENLAIVRAHLEFGTNPDEAFIPPGFDLAGAAALHLAVVVANRETVELLLDGGADIDLRSRDPSASTPLDWAAYFGKREMAMLLVERGADLNAQNAYGSTPLDSTAAENPFVTFADLAQFIADRESIRQYLREEGAESGVPLIEAITLNDGDRVRELLAAGRDPNKSYIPIGFQLAGASALHLAVLMDSQEIVEVLLDAGTNLEIETRDAFGSTPLAWAAFFGKLEMTELLARRGADIDAVTRDGNSVLDLTRVENPFVPPGEQAKLAENREIIRAFLLERGAQAAR